MEWSIEIYSNDSEYDGASEPYGTLSVDFGNQKGIKLWEVARDNYLEVTIGEYKTITGRYEFTDETNVAASGEMLTLHGRVSDRDYTYPDRNVDDVMGSYEGEEFTAAELRNGQTFKGRLFLRNGDVKSEQPKSRVTIKISVMKWTLLDYN